MSHRSHYVIIAKASGLFAWGGKFASKDEAFEDFNARVGIDPHGRGLGAVAREDFITYRVTPAQLQAVEKWHDAGSPADQWPLENMRSE